MSLLRPLQLELFVAIRYLFARRGQAVISVVTLISVLGVTAGVMALNIALALNGGIRNEFQARILAATSHVNLLNADPGPLSDYEEVVPRLRQVTGLVALTPSVYGQGLLISEFRQQPAVVKGIRLEDPDGRRFLPPIVEGSVENLGAGGKIPGILIGEELASSLAVSTGERIRIMGLAGELSPLGRMPRVQTVQIAGIFASGLWEYDANWVLFSLPDAQRFFGMAPTEVSAVEMRIDEIDRAQEVALSVKAAAGPGYAVNTWIELNRPLFAALELERLAMFVAIGLIILVASLNIVGTLTLMVMDKSGDIAIISAMGGTGATVTIIFMLQGLLIGLVGTVLGDLLGVSAALYLDAYRIFPLEPKVYAIPYVPFHVNGWSVAVVSVLAVLISFLATLYPARAASRLNPVEALRYE